MWQCGTKIVFCSAWRGVWRKAVQRLAIGTGMSWPTLWEMVKGQEIMLKSDSWQRALTLDDAKRANTAIS